MQMHIRNVTTKQILDRFSIFENFTMFLPYHLSSNSLYKKKKKNGKEFQYKTSLRIGTKHGRIVHVRTLKSTRG